MKLLLTPACAVAALALTFSALTACTNGAPGAIAGDTANVTTINVSLTAFAATAIAAGRSGGYAPAQIVVPVGTRIRFINMDSFAHTASSVGGGPGFPSSSPLTANALTPSAPNTGLSARGWSSGNLAAGSSSPTFVADVPGTYLFGCFYHYAAPMRGAVVVR